jgi:glycosyltransferase involved in cell wall biosynthesis
LAAIPGVRRVFDCGDNWCLVLPERRKALSTQYRRIGVEADAVIVNARPLAQLFGSREVAMVPNGASPELLATPLSPSPTGPVLVYAGTLSERFDAPLMAAVLERLVGWRLEIFGECRYAGHGGRPAAEVLDLVDRFPERVTRHGAKERDELAECLDRGKVFVLPHRPTGAVTGDAMKLYDYAARGRPIVSTTWSDHMTDDAPPGMRLADTAEAFAAAIESVQHEPVAAAGHRREWAEARSWEQRWPLWSRAALGS